MPKISTGYLTPQAKKTTKSRRKSLSSHKDKENAELMAQGGIDDKILTELMKCPEKKKLILQLLSANKEAIKEYIKENPTTPVAKIKSTKKVFESPSALLRRRALEQMSSSPSSSNRSEMSRPESRCSDTSESSTATPRDKILDGVVAYVEIQSHHNEDRSAGVKAVLRSLGATVQDRFSRDVTHVVFKDGSYTTFQKARLLKVHVVSVLWVEFSRKLGERQSEKKYPALRSDFDDETMVCSQMLKEYEEIVRYEYRKSISQGTPLPTTQSLLSRRRTLFTPSVSHLSSSSGSFKTAKDSSSAEPLSEKSLCNNSSEMPNKTAVEKVAEATRLSDLDMDITNIANPEETRNMTDRTTPKNSAQRCNRRKTICNSMLVSVSDKSVQSTGVLSSDTSTNVSSGDSLFPKPKSAAKKSGKKSTSTLGEWSNESIILGGKRVKTPKRVTKRSDGLVLSSDDGPPKTTNSGKTPSKLARESSSAQSLQLTTSAAKVSMSPLQLASSVSNRKSSSSLSLRPGPKGTESDISLPSLCFSSERSGKKSLLNSTRSNKESPTISMPPLRLSSDESKISQSDVLMSSLRLSSEKTNKPQSDKGRSSESMMSKLQLSSEENQKSGSDFSSNCSDNVSNGVIQGITDNLTDYNSQSLSSNSAMSDESEIVASPVRPTKKVNKELFVKVNKSPELEQKLGHVRSTSIIRSLSPEAGRNDNSKDGSCIQKRPVRKLFNPNDSITLPEVDDEQERQERIRVRKRKSDEGVNPLEFLANTSKTAVDRSADESEVELILPDITPSKRKRKPNKTSEKEIVTLNRSADEQKELLNEVLNKDKADTCKQTPNRRKSLRIQSQQKTPVATRTNGTPRAVSPVNRRSTLEFVPHSQVLSRRKKTGTSTGTVKKVRLPTIVCTKLHKEDVQLFTQIVRKLGKFHVEDEVSDRTTHLVAGEAKRTINMLRAVARGCWVVNFEWVLQSLEQGRWLAEENFEVTEFSPAVQKSRVERQAFGASYTLDVLENCPPIYVAPSTNPRASDLKELILLCKGKTMTTPRMARIVIGQYVKQIDTVCVNESWLLDTITLYKKMPFTRKYLITPKKQSIVV